MKKKRKKETIQNRCNIWKTFINNGNSPNNKSKDANNKFLQIKQELLSTTNPLDPNADSNIPETLEEVDMIIDQNNIKSLNDTTWELTNNLDKHIILQTGQLDVVEKRKLHDKEQQEKNKRAKRKKKKKKKKQEPEQEPQILNPCPPSEPQVEKVLPLNIVESLPIMDLEDYNLSGDENVMFINKLKKQDYSHDNIISRIPPQREIMRYCAKHKDKLPWYSYNQAYVTNTEGIDFQKMEVVNRDYIAQFLRECDPNAPEERPCLNLDRDPVQGDTFSRCESHRISEKRLGKGFKCREFLMPTIFGQIEAAKKHNRRKPKQKQIDASQWLPEVPEFCYLCYLKFVNRCYFGKLHSDVERNESDFTEQSNNDIDENVIFHKFMVPIDSDGEYKLDCTLTGDENPKGIVGPFPLYNCKAYTPEKTADGFYRFNESDTQVFRLGRESLLPIGSPPIIMTETTLGAPNNKNTSSLSILTQ